MMKKKLFMPLNLQFFAEDGGGNDPGDPTPNFNVDELDEEQLAAIH